MLEVPSLGSLLSIVLALKIEPSLYFGLYGAGPLGAARYRKKQQIPFTERSAL